MIRTSLIKYYKKKDMNNPRLVRNLRLDKVVFEFEMADKRNYSAHWYPNGSGNFAGYSEDEQQRKFEVSIFRGGGYKCSYYTNHRISEKQSKDFIKDFLGIKPIKSKDFIKRPLTVK